MGIWSFKEAADVLELAESSARRWVYSLESAGYQFGRIENRRKLTDEDMLALLRLKLLSQKMTLEEACSFVAEESVKEQPVAAVINEHNVELKEFEEELFKLETAIFWEGNKEPLVRLRQKWILLQN
ncbi:hypothetical protein GC101_18065 [Paenibacillus sp. LMG 31459]|uniref:HTH merR-type domain-containing protein n=1 Tax=Paenibacillus phytohabitans TaxID=2654978 RepID=A0ABX1YIX6_9BACL|nr:hypothetical protein [Paenibacillus phytohabitans]NOU80771.1 hypothetical protein [Paenibacillus phytohabitans]